MRRTVTFLLVPLAVAWLGATTLPESAGDSEALPGIRYQVIDLGTLGGPNSEAWGINNAGQVVGRAHLPPDSGGNLFHHAFLYQNGVMTDLGTIGAGCSQAHSWAFDINDAGQVVGQTCSNGLSRAFRYSGGTMVDLGTLGGAGSSARGINNAGDVVGSAAIRLDASAHAFLYRSGVMLDLGTIGGAAWSEAYQINDNGRIVGFSEIRPLPNREPHAFLYSDSAMIDLFPGAPCCSSAYGINDAGKVVGTGNDRGFLYSNGVVTDLGTLVGGQTTAMSINRSDQIVGYSALGYSYYHAFRYANGTMIDLNNHRPDNREWDLNVATAINDAGQIVGYGTVAGRTHAFLLTPVPTARDDTYATEFESALTVPTPGVLTNDTNAGTGAMTVEVVTTVAHGSLALGTDGSFRYTPVPGYVGADSFTYRVSNVHGPGNVGTASLTIKQPTNPQPPTNLFIHSVVDNVVTLRWTAPTIGPSPTGYRVEGGMNPGEVLATMPTGSAEPIHTFVPPTGSFYVRVRALAGADQSAPSNEVRIYIKVPIPPSPPADLTSVVDGSSVNLSWRNTFAGGAPNTLLLEARTTSGLTTIALPLTEMFGTEGVPDGTYIVRLRAVNAGGMSSPSNEVVVTTPSRCSGAPHPPSGFLVYSVGRTIFVTWDPPATGPAATAYDLNVAGAYVGSFTTLGRALSAYAGPGSYHLSVVSRNACGSSPATATDTVTVR